MRFARIALTTTAAVGMIAVGVAVPSQAGLTTSCDGTASDVTVPGDLVVPAGASCELTNVVITGNATVRGDADLLLTGATVEGNLRVQANGYVDLVDSDVVGTTRLATAFGGYAENSSLGGNVVAADSGFFYSVGSSHGRDVTSTNGETFLESATVTRHLSTTGDALTDVYDTVVGGAATVDGAVDGSVFCLSEVDGNASFTGNGDTLQIGGSAFDCGFNVFGADLAVTGNTATTAVEGNVVRGDLTCSDNAPLPVVTGNRVRGAVDCEGAEAAAASRFSAQAADIAEARKADVRAEAEARSAAATDAAEDAGPAFE